MVARARLEVQHPAETSTEQALDVAATTRMALLALPVDTVAATLIRMVPLAVLAVVVADMVGVMTRTAHLVSLVVAWVRVLQEDAEYSDPKANVASLQVKTTPMEAQVRLVARPRAGMISTGRAQAAPAVNSPVDMAPALEGMETIVVRRVVVTTIAQQESSCRRLAICSTMTS